MHSFRNRHRNKSRDPRLGILTAGSIDVSNGVPQVSGRRSEGSGTSHNAFSENFWGMGGFPGGTAREFKRFRKEAGGFHDQFCWNEAEQGTPRPGGLNLRGEVVGMGTGFDRSRRDRRRPGWKAEVI